MEPASCPNCREPMDVQKLSGGHIPIEIDVCYSCHGFWFDHMESPGLSNTSILKLFEVIRQHRDAHRHTLGARLGCPRCKLPLVRSQDLQRGNKLEYHRCTRGHGRFTTFYQFLREKNFVRNLNPVEMKELRVHVSQVRCSSCGAMVNLEKDAACSHCRAPISILDADAVEKTLVVLKDKSARETTPAPIRQTHPGDFPLRGRSSDRRYEPRSAWDLVTDALDTAFEWTDWK